MNLYATTTLFALIILVYWVISEVFTVLFRLIGLPEERARFQVISLLTGCGFTTHESEMILSNRSRRRLARITMLFGYVFNLTIVSSLINMFVSISVTTLDAKLLSLLIPFAATIGIIVVSRVRPIRLRIDRWLERIAGRVTGKAGQNSIVQLDQIGDDTIAQVTLNSVPASLQDVPLAKAGRKSDYNILVMLVERSDAPAQPADANTVFAPGDRLTLFGNYQRICAAFDAREYFSGADDT